MEKPKYSVHLFAGGGGGILADLLEGITPVCAVEIMEYQRTVLGLRFPGLPIWDDVRTFRAVKPYWTKRIGALVGDNAPRFILFQIGYAKDGPRLLVQTTGVDVGPCPYPGWSGGYYRIRFEIVHPYMRADGVFYPMAEMPRMKDKKGGAE